MDSSRDPLLEILDQALELPAAERQAFVEKAAAGDQKLLAKVLHLLSEESGTEDWDLESSRTLMSPILGADQYPLLGNTIGPWRLVRVLGEGGMGTVYLGERIDEAFTQEVAIKLIKEDLRRESMLERFAQERHIHATLNHPGIATLLDAGRTSDGIPYFVMEFVPGSRIDHSCENHDLSATARIELFQKVCRVVHDTHELGVVHRDLKPSNIMVQPDGSVKLLDFGVSLVLGGGQQDQDGKLPFITPAYASPETFGEQQASRASDQYSLAVILQELLTDRRPTPAQGNKPTQSQPLAALLPSGATPLSRLRRGSLASYSDRSRFLRDLRAILARALDTDPRKRYATVFDFEQDLDRLLAGELVSANRPGPWQALRRRAVQYRWGILGFGLLATLLAASLIFTQRKEREYRDAIAQSTQSRAEAEEHALAMERFANTILTGLEDRLRSAPGAHQIRERLLSIGTEFFESGQDQGDTPKALLITILDSYQSLAMLLARPMEGGGSDMSGAIVAMDKAMELVDTLESIDPSKGRARRANLMVSWGVITWRNLHIKEGRELLETGMSLLDETDLSASQRMGYQMQATSNLAELNWNLGDRTKALQAVQQFRRIYDESLPLRDPERNPYLAGVAHIYLLNVACTLMDMGEADEAGAYYAEAQTNAWTHPDPVPGRGRMDISQAVGMLQRVRLTWAYGSPADREYVREGLNRALSQLDNPDLDLANLPGILGRLNRAQGQIQYESDGLAACKESYQASFRLLRYSLTKDPENHHNRLELVLSLLELAEYLKPDASAKGQLQSLRQEARAHLESLRRAELDHPAIERLIHDLEEV